MVTSDQATLADKHVFIDFYMQGCYYCFEFQQDWNRIVDEITAEYGPDNVQFLKVDGQVLSDIARKYGVKGFPAFYYIYPNTQGMQAIKFSANRSYQAMKSWMKRLLKDVPKVGSEEEPAVAESMTFTPSQPQYPAMQSSN